MLAIAWLMMMFNDYGGDMKVDDRGDWWQSQVVEIAMLNEYDK